MFTFSVVRKIGEGSYLAEDLFILERARRVKALNNNAHVGIVGRKAKRHSKNARINPS